MDTTALTSERTIQGIEIPNRLTFLSLTALSPDEPCEFAFAANETGLVYPDGRVFYDSEGTNQYCFDTKEDAYDFLFGSDELCPPHQYEYRHSFYIGSRDLHPTLDGWCKRMGIDVQKDEDGSSVYSDWTVVQRKET